MLPYYVVQRDCESYGRASSTSISFIRNADFARQDKRDVVHFCHMLDVGGALHVLWIERKTEKREDMRDRAGRCSGISEMRKRIAYFFKYARRNEVTYGKCNENPGRRRCCVARE